MSDEKDLKQQIADAVKEATDALAAKNRELLAELKAAKKGQEIKPEELEKLQAKNDALESELATVQKQVKEQTKLLEKAQTDLQAENGFTTKLLLDNGLTDALVKAGVSMPLLSAVKAMLTAQAKIIADGENRKVVIGEKDLTTFITEWSASDEGKHFISAPQNTGGGANGGQSGSTNNENLSPQQRLEKGLLADKNYST